MNKTGRPFTNGALESMQLTILMSLVGKKFRGEIDIDDQIEADKIRMVKQAWDDTLEEVTLTHLEGDVSLHCKRAVCNYRIDLKDLDVAVTTKEITVTIFQKWGWYTFRFNTKKK